MNSVLVESPALRCTRRPIVVDDAPTIPYAYSGLRRLLATLGEVAPDALEETARARAPEWAFLFPDALESSPNIPRLSELVFAVSERRLDGDSEHVFRVLDAAADATARAVATTGRPLILRTTDRYDPLTLRALVRVAERLGAADAYRAVCIVLSRRSPLRLAVSLGEAKRWDAELTTSDRLLAASVDPTRSPAEQVAAALAVLSAAFVAGDPEGRVVAASAGLSALRRRPRLSEVGDCFRDIGDDLANAAFALDSDELTSYPDLRALFWRALGVARAHTGDAAGALVAFECGLLAAPSIVSKARLLMYRGITFVKLLGQLERGAGELESGLSLVTSCDGSAARIEEAWLRNVLALVHYRTGDLDAAREQQDAALSAIATLPSSAAASLELTLRSNLVTIHEAAARLDSALAEWTQLGEMLGGWEANILKHHLYRGAWLRHRIGDVEGAIDSYSRAHAAAATTGDHFHEQAIAAELGTVALDVGRTQEAARWYARAETSAHRIGESLRVAESIAGAGLATGRIEARTVVAWAARSLTHSRAAEPLRTAVAAGDRERVRELLPRPRPTLQRPFGSAQWTSIAERSSPTSGSISTR